MKDDIDRIVIKPWGDGYTIETFWTGGVETTQSYADDFSQLVDCLAIDLNQPMELTEKGKESPE